MTESKHAVDAKILVVVLSLLSVVAVILVVANIMIPVLNRRNYDFSDDNLAKDCLLAEDEMSVDECLEDKAFSYYEEDDCEKALKVYDDIPSGWFEEDTLIHLYDEAYSLSLSCEDESLQSYWEEKNNKFMNRTEAKN